MIDKKVILERVDVLRQQRAQAVTALNEAQQMVERAVTTIHMIDGALQVLEQLQAGVQSDQAVEKENGGAA